jgi:cytochrome b involved in lipid metabolism
MTREDFDSRIRGGEKLCILDDMVLNVESFRADHPGGQFLIDFHVGRDVSKFFYGGYVLENQSGMSPYTHSNVARSIVNSLAIAKIIAPSETLQGTISSSHVINKSTKVFILQITAPSEANFRVPASTSVETIGKHYLFRSINSP